MIARQFAGGRAVGNRGLAPPRAAQAMHNDLFAAALGLSEPWFVDALDFDEADRQLKIRVDFRRGSRFVHDDGIHPVHDTQLKRHRHLNFFEHECVLEARVPRVRLPDGSVSLVEPPWVGRLSGFTLLFEALIITLCREMPFAAVARLTGVSWHRVHAICQLYVGRALQTQRQDLLLNFRRDTVQVR